MKVSLDALKQKDVERFNESLENLVEAIRDFNIIIGGLLKRKVTYGEKKEDLARKESPK